MSPPQSDTLTPILINDLYLAAYLLIQGACLQELWFNEDSKATLILTGQDIQDHKRAFMAGKVSVVIPRLKREYNHLRDTIYHYQHLYNNPKGKRYVLPRTN